jgi:chemotaxis signal transduction protein
VREVPNTLNIPDPLIDKSPAVLQEQSQMRNYITGIARYQEQLIILIDLFKAIDPQEIREIVQGED